MGLHEKNNRKQFQWTGAWNGALYAWDLDLWYLSEIFLFFEIWTYASARSQYIITWAATCDLDSDEPVQPPFKLTNSKRCSVNSLILIESDCVFVQADWSHIPHCCKSLVTAQIYYILSRHRTQSRTFAYMINSWYACCPWFGLARRRRSGSKLFAKQVW